MNAKRSLGTMAVGFGFAFAGCRGEHATPRAAPSASAALVAPPPTPPAPPNVDACRAILLLDDGGGVLTFTPDPPALAVVSHAACAVDMRDASPRSIAVEDDATIWAGAPDGRVVRIRARDGRCDVTALAPHQAGFAALNLTFAGATLWASDDHGWGGDVAPSLGLARVDRTKLTLAPIGNPAHGNRMILAGTADGALYAEPPVQLERIDTTKSPPTAKELTPFESFAKGDGVPMAWFRGAIYLFGTTMPPVAGNVVRFDPVRKTYAVVLPASPSATHIVAAGAAMCASSP